MLVAVTNQDSLTQRAPDWWESARFQAVSVAQSGFRQMAVSRLAHQRVPITCSVKGLEETK